ncbi:hypothetical protein [Rubrobacter indicoceani]|uniref:hypothetical protein n=1 Tax=Rubrobacter indicoceani TaxID=2051957 RepID=UPI0013C4FB7E|nr:hypothetical protein [Rubrobacter indicoceani]
MARISFVSDDAAPPEVRETYRAAQNDFGILFNTYRVLGHRPEILDAWHRLLSSILGSGSVEPQLKMLAFTAGSEANECNY